jgi:hypothetical protein
MGAQLSYRPAGLCYSIWLPGGWLSPGATTGRSQLRAAPPGVRHGRPAVPQG